MVCLHNSESDTLSETQGNTRTCEDKNVKLKIPLHRGLGYIQHVNIQTDSMYIASMKVREK